MSTVWARKFTSGEAVPLLITCCATGSASLKQIVVDRQAKEELVRGVRVLGRLTWPRAGAS